MPFLTTVFYFLALYYLLGEFQLTLKKMRRCGIGQLPQIQRRYIPFQEVPPINWRSIPKFALMAHHLYMLVGATSNKTKKTRDQKNEGKIVDEPKLTEENFSNGCQNSNKHLMCWKKP